MVEVGVFLSTAHFPSQPHEEVFENALAYAQTEVFACPVEKT
jgi:hypothetical protein